MTYLKRSNLGAKKNKRTLFFVALTITFFVSIDFIFPSLYVKLLSPVSSSVWTSKHVSKGIFARMGDFISSKNSLVLKNINLENELREHEADSLIIKALRHENDSLKESMKRKTFDKEILAVVLSRPPASFYDTLMLDVGSSDGIYIGQKVYVYNSIIIGDISEVSNGSSQVSLFSTPGRSTPVFIGEKHIETQAIGRGGGNFSARIPADIIIAEGDIVTSPQLRTNVFGVVEKIIVGSTDSIQTIYFRAPFNMHELQYVNIDINQ